MTVSFEEYLNIVRELPETCVFRGQRDSSWKLQSAATRRLVEHYDHNESLTASTHFSQTYILYHRIALLEPARTFGFGVDEGLRISDLQLLAKLQHFGAATGLIDFTWDPLVALWFACENVLDRKGGESNGAVFAIDLSDPLQFQKLSSENETISAELLLSPATVSGKHLYWEPMSRGEATPRILRQQSVFLIGRPSLPESILTSFEISAEDKQEILIELESIHRINRQTLFADLQGFSTVNGPRSPLKPMETPVNFLLQGNRFFREKDFHNAISNYSRCIDLDGDACEPFFLRGNTWTELEEYKKAEKDFGLALRYQDRPFLSWKRDSMVVPSPIIFWPLFFNRGNVRAAQNDFEGALADYDEVIRLFEQFGDSNYHVLTNRGNACFNLRRFEAAADDFSKAARLGVKSALFNRGNALVALGRFDEAVQVYDEDISVVEDHGEYAGNRNWAKYIIDRIDESEYEVSSPDKDMVAGLMTIDVSIESSDSDGGTESLVFKGNVGNSGNVGFNGSPGTSGFPGFNAFVVRV